MLSKVNATIDKVDNLYTMLGVKNGQMRKVGVSQSASCLV